MLAETKRRFTAIVMTGAVSLALTGCYTMKTENVYHADGSIDATVLIAMDDSLLDDQFPDASDPAQSFVDETTGTPEMEALRDQLGDHLTLEPYARDGQSGLLMTMEGVTLEQIAEVNAAQGTPAGNAVVTVADGTMTLKYTADPALMSSYNESLGSLEGMGVDPAALSSYVDFEARHTFPGPVVSTTIGEIDPKNPNSVIITDLTDMSSAQDYTIVASDGSAGTIGSIALWLAIAGLLALAAIAGLIIWRKRGARRADVAAAGAIPVDDAIDAAPLWVPAGEPELPAGPASSEQLR